MFCATIVAQTSAPIETRDLRSRMRIKNPCADQKCVGNPCTDHTAVWNPRLIETRVLDPCADQAPVKPVHHSLLNS